MFTISDQGESPSFLLLCLKRTAFCLSPVSMMIVFVQVFFIKLKKFPATFVFLRVLLPLGVEFCQKVMSFAQSWT